MVQETADFAASFVMTKSGRLGFHHLFNTILKPQKVQYYAEDFMRGYKNAPLYLQNITLAHETRFPFVWDR